MLLLDPAARAAASAGGQVLRAATALIAARPAAKPCTRAARPSTALCTGSAPRPPTGAEWLDLEGVDRVVVRQSRAVGLPSPAPDIFGLALRVSNDGGRPGDLLFASTGTGRLGRVLLAPARSPRSRALTTLLPYRSAAGPVLLSAVFQDRTTVELSWAIGLGAWHRFAELRLDEEPVDQPDAPLSFDPLGNTVSGLAPYDWVRRLRAPAYATARRSRSN
jgi:hypothetical protein